MAVIGDGSMSAGMAYEAMNNAAETTGQLTVILNDNDMSIAPPVGGMSAYMARLVSGGGYRSIRAGRQVDGQGVLPSRCRKPPARPRNTPAAWSPAAPSSRSWASTTSGPIDGHDMDALVHVLQNARAITDKPVLVHVVTQKGKGYGPAENAADKHHAVVKFDVVTGQQAKGQPARRSYTKVFAQELIKRAEIDPKIVAITAAMPSGTGLDLLRASASPSAPSTSASPSSTR